MVAITLRPTGRTRLFRKTYTLEVSGKSGNLQLTNMRAKMAFAKTSEVALHCAIHGTPFSINGVDAGRMTAL